MKNKMIKAWKAELRYLRESQRINGGGFIVSEKSEFRNSWREMWSWDYKNNEEGD